MKASKFLSIESKNQQFGFYAFLKKRYNLKISFEKFLTSTIQYSNH